MIGFKFTPWQPFEAVRDRNVDRKFLKKAGQESRDAFQTNMDTAKSGRKYPRLPRRSSAPGEFPANQFGPLKASSDFNSSTTEMNVGTNTFYSKWLRDGTTKMKPRKMSWDAMQIGIPIARPLLKGWIKWSR